LHATRAARPFSVKSCRRHCFASHLRAAKRQAFAFCSSLEACPGVGDFELDQFPNALPGPTGPGTRIWRSPRARGVDTRLTHRSSRTSRNHSALHGGAILDACRAKLRCSVLSRRCVGHHVERFFPERAKKYCGGCTARLFSRESNGCVAVWYWPKSTDGSWWQRRSMEWQVAGIKRAIASLGRGMACQTRLSKMGVPPGAAMTENPARTQS